MAASSKGSMKTLLAGKRIWESCCFYIGYIVMIWLNLGLYTFKTEGIFATYTAVRGNTFIDQLYCLSNIVSERRIYLLH